jgi:hypothetical protein
MFHPLLSHSAQWREADFRFSYEEFIGSDLHSRLHGKLPALETLRVEIESDYSQAQFPTPITLFEKAPKLQTVILDLTKTFQLEKPLRTIITLPWTQITRFESSLLSSMGCLEVTRSAPCLVDCIFNCVREELKGSLSPPQLSSLEFLTLQGGWDCHDLVAILTSTQLPKLRALHFSTGFYSERRGAFVSFGMWPSETSGLFERRGSDVLPWCLVERLEPLTELASLTLGCLSIPDFEDLLCSLQRDSATFLPNLKFILICLCPDDDESKEDIDYEAMADALESRWNGSNELSSFQSFNMEWRADGSSEESISPPSSFQAVLPRLLDLVEDGMHISIAAKTETKVTRVVWL